MLPPSPPPGSQPVNGPCHRKPQLCQQVLERWKVCAADAAKGGREGVERCGGGGFQHAGKHRAGVWGSKCGRDLVMCEMSDGSGTPCREALHRCGLDTLAQHPLQRNLFLSLSYLLSFSHPSLTLQWLKTCWGSSCLIAKKSRSPSLKLSLKHLRWERACFFGILLVWVLIMLCLLAPQATVWMLNAHSYLL